MDGPWEAQQRRAFTMTLVVRLRDARDASSTTPSLGLTVKPTPPTASVRRTPPTRDISSQTWGRALDWTTPLSTAPSTTGSTGIRAMAIAQRPGTAPAVAPVTGTTGARELEGTPPAMKSSSTPAQMQTTAVKRLAETG